MNHNPAMLARPREAVHVKTAKHNKLLSRSIPLQRVPRRAQQTRRAWVVRVSALLGFGTLVVFGSPTTSGSTRKFGIRREMSTVDLTNDLAPNPFPSTAQHAPPTKVPVMRANSFIGVTPQITPDDYHKFDPRVLLAGAPKRGNSFSIAPPRRETSQADLSSLATPAPAQQTLHIERDAETAAAEEELKQVVLKSPHGLVLGQVSPEEEDIWRSRIVYTGEVLGVGGFSVVHAAKDVELGLQYAVKVVNIPKDNACFVRRLTREVRLLEELDHPNIVKLHKVLESSATCHLFMEHCQGGELLGLMEHMEFSDSGVRSLQFDNFNGGEPLEFTEEQVVFILHQVLQAVKHCHDRNIVHRDLKMENLLLCQPWQHSDRHVKLADFGFATVLEADEHLTSACGSPHYCSPEVLNGNTPDSPGYRIEGDMWAVGIVAYSLLCCQYPFDGDNDSDVVKAVAAATFEFPDHVVVSADAQDFVRSLIVRDIKERYTVDEALAHPWIAQNVAAGTAHAASLAHRLERERERGAGEGFHLPKVLE